jgi:protein-L-isoaspartate(D-aspartate) O-methyltransferase
MMKIIISLLGFMVLVLAPAALFAHQCPSAKIYAERRKDMVEKQIHSRGVMDRRVLAAMLKVERHRFIPEELCDMAYEDTPLPIRFDQTISQPYIVSFMTEALKLEPTDRVLEIGTGSGYQAAVLAELAKEVYTIEIVEKLGEAADARLKELGYKNVYVKIGDGYKGWPEEAPFDAIIATAAPSNIPDALINQLKVGGRMVIPVGTVFQELFLVTKTAKGYDKRSLLPVKFVPMVTPFINNDKPKEAGRGGLFK